MGLRNGNEFFCHPVLPSMRMNLVILIIVFDVCKSNDDMFLMSN